MKKIFLLVISAAALSSCAHKSATTQNDEKNRRPADMSKVATLDLVCASAGNPVVKVMSQKLGAAIHIGGKMFSLERPLSAGTEGGDPYIQHVDNDAYNIIIRGEDLNTAFYADSNVTGNLKMNVQLFEGDQFKKEVTFSSACIGTISFKR